MAFATLLLCAGYTRWLNPEVRFYQHAVRIKQAWIQHLPHTSPRIIVSGGSSAAFAIDAERLLHHHGLPVANFGLHAGMGPWFLTAAAADATRPGDLLLASLEPGLLAEPFETTDLAAQMGFALGQPEWIHGSRISGRPVQWAHDLARLRPGAYHAFTLLGKLLLGRPLYRYQPADLAPSGWQRTAERRDLGHPVATPVRLSADARDWLARTQDWAKREGVQVAYLLPWRFAPADENAAFRRAHLAFLQDIAEYLPIVPDPTLGLHNRREHFADTPWHLTAAGAALRSDQLAEQLQRPFWGPADLATLRGQPDLESQPQ